MVYILFIIITKQNKQKTQTRNNKQQNRDGREVGGKVQQPLVKVITGSHFDFERAIQGY